MFKDNFKYYKSRNPRPNLKNVIDLNNPDYNKVISFKEKLLDIQCEHELGLKSIKHWKVFEFLDIPGLIFIKNPFTTYGQRYWIIKCLKEYSKKPHKLNLHAHDILNDDENWWDICFKNFDKGEINTKLISKLRWATFGYHHNWDTKLYSETCKTKIPIELSLLTSFLAQTLGFKDFKAEAAIINYYRMNSTLAGHTDHSEPNVEAPLFSISFGQTAIFLIGGLMQEDTTNAIFLRSGDIIIMSGMSRLRYHGIPKILLTIDKPWDNEELNDDQCTRLNQNDWKKAKIYISDARINMNVRQVLKVGQFSLL
ncbi:Alkylated DNA repair protein alkB [Apis cerana cerana]|uniref:Alkylated DNA repair protein alkB n=1 Tax=Apis cerana cerana TaxID=94128 RepID=A0A2A3EQL1_APICC|nr:Alkylated DNA repair protein alkB [Apis cerana cerana]